MKKWNNYIKIELPEDYTEEKIELLKNEIEIFLVDFDNQGKIKVKNVCYTTN